MPQYTFYFLNGKKYSIGGDSPSDALNRAGFGAGAMTMLDFYESAEQAKTSDYAWNPQKRKWESARIIAQARADFHGADLDPSKPSKATVVGSTVVAVSQHTDISSTAQGSPDGGYNSYKEGKKRARLTASGKLRREVVTVYSIRPFRRDGRLIYELDLGGRKVRSDTEGAQQLNRMEPSRSGQRMCLWFNSRGTVSKVSKA